MTIPYLLSILSGLLYSLCFPPFNFSFVAWFALTPLLIAAADRWRRNFFLGFLSGFIANLSIFFWLWPTFKAAKIGAWVTLGSWFSLSAILALYFGAFLAIYGLLPNTWWKSLLAGAAWVVLEEIRTRILTGFPWALFAHTQAYNLPFIQITSLTGALGVSYLLVMVNAAIIHRDKKEKIMVIATLFLVFGFGLWRLKKPVSIGDSAFLKVTVLQGNIDQYEKWDDTYETNIRNQYEILAAYAASIKPDLIVWPESSVPGWFPVETRYDEWVRNLVKKTKTHNLVGSVTKNNEKPLNSAFLLNPNGEIIGQYDKRHLVPYGEYVPFGSFLGRWIPYIGELGIFEAGEKDNLLTFGFVPMSVNICYEAMFPGLVRKSVNQGAKLIVNVTNDGWFLLSAAPEQHYVTNIFRAIENGRPVVRAANTGISGIIDEQGRELARSKLMDRTVLEGSVMIPQNGRTLYSRGGPWFSVLCAMAILIFFIRRHK